MRIDNSNLVSVSDDLFQENVVSSRKSVVQIANVVSQASNMKLLSSLSADFPATPITGYGSLVNYAPNADRPVHRWFWYREGYSIELVKDLIKDLPKGSVILDPFCGAGTSLLAARELGYPSIGFDVNPISILVSRVKTAIYTEELKKAIATQVNLLADANVSMPVDSKPELKIIDKVYDANVLKALLIFRFAIKAISQREVREFCFVAWLSILEQVSNVYKEGNGIKYRNRKRTDEGYIQLDLASWQDSTLPANRFEFVKGELLSKLKDMCADLDHMPTNISDTTIVESPAESIGEHLHENSISMAVFSPPYCNCFNYFKMYKVELWMGEFVSSYDELKELNRRGLRSHVETILRRDDDVAVPEAEEYARLLDGLELWDKRIPNAVRGYFIDMTKVMQGLYKALKPSGKAIIVVGNSAYGGVVIPTDALLAKIAERLGFRTEKISVARHLTTSSQQRSMLGDRMEYLRESLVVLVKDDPRLVDRDLVPADEIPSDDAARRGNVFAIRNAGLTAGTHKFHRYPGKFIPHLPRWAIGRFLGKGEGKVLLDPFCGSGTTVVEGRIHGLHCYGIDIDPIARLVSRVKTTHICADRLDAVVREVSAQVAEATSARFSPSIPTLSHWFNSDAVRDLGIIRDVIEQYKEETRVYEFLLVCLASIVRKASNADNQTQKTYVSGTRIKEPEPAKPLFLSALADYATRLKAFVEVTGPENATILDRCNATNFGNFWEAQGYPKVDLIVSSPPYLNSVDYVYNQMAEYFWIGDLFGMETQSKQNEHKRNYVGTMKVDAAEYRNEIRTGIPSIDNVIAAVTRKSQKNGYVVGKYFVDMLEHFVQAAKVMRPGAHYVSIVGDSLVSGESIIVHELVADCARAAGFELEGHYGYEIRNRHMRFPRMGRGGIVRYDWVLELVRK